MAQRRQLMLVFLLMMGSSICWSQSAGNGDAGDNLADDNGIPLDELPQDDSMHVNENTEDQDHPDIFTIEDEDEDLEVTRDGHFTGHADTDSKDDKDDEFIYDDSDDDEDENEEDYTFDGDINEDETDDDEDENESEDDIDGDESEIKKRHVRDVTGLENDVDDKSPNPKELETQSHRDKMRLKLKPVGPIAERAKIKEQFVHRFNSNAKDNVKWEEPEILSNCWGQAMLSTRYSFAPSCNEDGSFSPKQCFLERCWCVNPGGSSQVQEFNKRFHYAMEGILLRCYQNRLP